MFGRKKKSAGEIAAQKIRDNPPKPEQYRTIEEYRAAEDAFTPEGLAPEGVEYRTFLTCSGCVLMLLLCLM